VGASFLFVAVLVTIFYLSAGFRQFLGIYGEEAIKKRLQQIQIQQAALEPI